MADSGVLPEHWSIDSLSMLQLYWIAYWRRKREQKQMRGLGEMLGVIWHADTYKRSDPNKTPTRVKEAFIPLATLLNGDQLYKTLDKILDVNPGNSPGAAATKDPNSVDMSTLSVNAYRKLFEEAAKPTKDGGLLPLAPAVAAASAEKPAETAAATPSVQSTVDLERVRAVDPELARHLDADAAW